MPFSRNFPSLVFGAVALAALSAHPVFAQPAPADPLSPSPSAAPLTYRSAFEGYRSFRIDEIPGWRTVNETVGSVGGHTGSVRDGAKPVSPAASGAAPKTPEQPAPPAMPREPVERAPMNGHGR